MFLVIKLLLLEVCLFNLENAISIQQHDKNNSENSNFTNWWDSQNDNYSKEPLSTRQYNNQDTYSNSQNTNKSAPDENHNIMEYSSDTKNYNTAISIDEPPENTTVQLNPYEEAYYNTNSTSSDHFYTQLTSNVPNEFPWKPPMYYENIETDQDELPQQATPPVATSISGIVNYKKATLPKCPNRYIGLTYFGEYFNYSICYFMTEPTSFPPQCPYPTNVEYYSISQYFQITDQQHWTFTYRNVSDIGKKNCYVTNGTVEKNLIPTRCDDKYPGVCAYSYDVNFQKRFFAPTFSQYCTKHYNRSCISNDMNSPSTCYCKTNINTEKPAISAFCKKLVEIKHPYENNFLVKLLSHQERCWIGLHKNKDSYVWSSTNTTNNYTFWSSNTDFSKTYGALGAEGWFLEEDGALNCAICEIEIKNHPPIHIHIQHNKATHTLDVEIKNASGVFQEVICYGQNTRNYQKIDMRDNKHDFLQVKLNLTFRTSGYYWCKALQIPTLTPIYSNTILIPPMNGNEYTLLITFPQPDASLPESTEEFVCSSLRSPLYKVIFDSNPVKLIKRNEEDKTLEVLCHITINSTQPSKAKEFDMISKLLKNSTARITNLASVDVCLPSVTNSRSQTLNWPETPIGVTIIPEELCLEEDGSPVTRTCAGDFYYGSQWLDVNGTCADVTYSHRTQLLHDLLKSNITTPSTLSTDLLQITGDNNNFTSFEIHLVSKALVELATFNKSFSVNTIAKTVNNIMHFEPNNLRVAQETLNSTDMILYSLDEILAQTKIDESGYTSEVTEKLVVQISDLKKTNVVGIKLGKTQNGFDSTTIKPLPQGTSQKDLIRENFDVALLIPQQLQDEIINCVGEKASPNLIATVFYDDVLFNEQNNTSNDPDGKIIGVTIPNFNCNFTTPLQIIFNPSTNNSTRLKCASWVYGFNDELKSTYGQWFIEGDPKTFDNSKYQVCEFSHITHFALLVLGGNDDISEGHKKALDIITAVGSGLSILGLLVVFITAVKFKTFRSANAVVINFAIAMTAQIVLLFVADNVAENKVLCIVFGAVLHYIVLAQFCWMLTIAILQYRRYVVIFSSPTPYLVTKACACSWGIPLIPVIIIISISRDNYGENFYGLCYALGNYFIFGVLIPVSLIILINLIVFLRIMLSIASSRNIKVHQKRDDTSSLQLRLAVMLYFVLGLTWGFGLLAAIGGGIVYSYIFCITATLQGFILFLYFIVLNEKTRSLWTNMKSCHCKGKSDQYDVNTDSAATAMMRNPRNTASSNTNTSSTTSEMLRKYKNRSSSEF